MIKSHKQLCEKLECEKKAIRINKAPIVFFSTRDFIQFVILFNRWVNQNQNSAESNRLQIYSCISSANSNHITQPMKKIQECETLVDGIDLSLTSNIRYMQCLTLLNYSHISV